MSKSADNFARSLAYLASVARAESVAPEWHAACDMLASGAIVPPADRVAPAMLAEAGGSVVTQAAHDCVSFVVWTKRAQDAAEALDKLQPYYPRRVADHKRDGWAEDDIHATYAEADKQRAAFMRARLAAKKGA